MGTKKKPVAIIIPTFNMPEAAGKLEMDIESRVEYPHHLIVVDNGSEWGLECRNAAVTSSINLQTTLGIQLGLDYAKLLERKLKTKFAAIWLMTTSVKFPTRPASLARLMEIKNKYNAVAVSPAWIGGDDDSPTHLEMKDGGSMKERRTWIGGLNTLWDRDFLMNYFNTVHSLTYSWGVDYLLSWHARKLGNRLYVHEGVVIEVEKDAGYKLDRMGMNATERAVLARDQMTTYFNKIIGENWEEKLRTEFTDYG